MNDPIAIVGMACRYPDACSPEELWENALAERRAFRRMPPERLRLEDYLSPDRDQPDAVYSAEAALIEGYEFDRVKYRVSGTTFRQADPAHWLALDIAAQALADAGFGEGEGLPREATGVVLGNTLTGEFSRANLLRLRWPYVRRVLDAALIEEGRSPEERHAFLDALEPRYKEPFPPVGEETLAGGLSNTIAGRICNHFDLNGGGYTVDGACASSLLAVTSACTALAAGDLDVALAGGVDLSLDPFELVGFAKTRALAPEEMRVYDARAQGFWPGEGCGFVVLMRHEDALAQGRRVYTLIRGWGVSSDGSGGITRPEVEGQLLALHRAYRRAGFPGGAVTYFEGHGTGTSVGDATELEALSRVREGAESTPAVVSSIKANIGHTKAAAGVAGLIKATMALHTQILPPATACEQPGPRVSGDASALQVLRQGALWPTDRPLRAGVSAMGFGGINTHVALEGVAAERRGALGERERSLVSTPQDAELFLLGAGDGNGLRQQVEQLLAYAARLSRAELADLAAQLEKALEPGVIRAAVVASRPAELARGLQTLVAWLDTGVERRLDSHAGIFLGSGTETARIGLLFPGQGSPLPRDGGGALGRRFEAVRALYARADLPETGDGVATAVAQPAIVAAELAALAALDAVGIAACVAVGHSLGELTALHWAGAMDDDALLRIARARGRAMTEVDAPPGAMASLGAGQAEAESLLDGSPVVLAGLNSPRQTVISGPAEAVASVVERARARGIKAVPLRVSHAFHSPLVAPAAPVLADHLRREDLRPLSRAVVSTVTGKTLAPDADLRALLSRQVTAPVRFTEAFASAGDAAHLWIEAGPGRILTGLAGECADVPVIALDAGGPSFRGLLEAAGVAFALGAPVDHAALFAGRFFRPFDRDWRPRFFVNPCELAPVPESGAALTPVPSPVTPLTPVPSPAAGRGVPITLPVPASREAGVGRSPGTPLPAAGEGTGVRGVTGEGTGVRGVTGEGTPLDIVRELVAERAELPVSAVREESRLLGDLHLNSLSVGTLVGEAARRLGLTPPVSPTDYANATVGQLARALEERARTGEGDASGTDEPRAPAGVDAWIRAFSLQWVQRPLRRGPARQGAGKWRIFAAPDHPLAQRLGEALSRSGNGGIVVCLPPEPDERVLGLLLAGAHAAMAETGNLPFVLVQHGGGAASFARTLHLEAPEIAVCVVDVPPDHPDTTNWICAEAAAMTGFVEARYDADGHRWEPLLRLLPLGLEEDGAKPPLGPADVLLVTGGGKGIAAECALALARETGARLALLGRSDPAVDAELAANLERMAASGVAFRYLRADVTDADAVRAAVGEAETHLGAITAVLHGAGANAPRLLGALDEADFARTLAPKVGGAENVLAALDPERLRLFVAFGSIIARTGMRGEADYALANEWLTRQTERFAAEHPRCRCLVVEWSVWSGVGMGERLGRVDALVRAGVTPIGPDAGVRLLRELLARPPATVPVVVAGRFGEPPTLTVEQPELPLRRFLERSRVHYPGVELIVEADLSPDTDPYLDDHRVEGQRLFPAVLGLEAMAQAAMALAEASEPPVFEDVAFERPIVAAGATSLTLRIAALVRAPGRIEVALRSGENGFAVDHFRATCRFGEGAASSAPTPRPNGEPLDLDPGRDLYGGILFHRGRFRRLRGYRRLRATECVAEIAAGEGGVTWFGRYLPATLVLGDPAARDAAIHAVQSCIPHRTLLPTGVDRLEIRQTTGTGVSFVHARERSRDGDLFVYDLDVTGEDGSLRERWEGLRLRAVHATTLPAAWPEPLLGPYVERRIQELIPGVALAVAVERNGSAERRERSDRAIEQALGTAVPVCRRPDGKPEVSRRVPALRAGGDTDPEVPGAQVSAAHAGDLTLAVAGPGPLGCDVEPVTARPTAVWRDLLGPERWSLAEIIARETGEDADTAATRVWTAVECLKKAGAAANAPLTLAFSTAGGWLLLASGPLVIASCVAPVRGASEPLALAVLAKSGGDAGL